MRNNLKFNGIKKPWIIMTKGRKKDPFAPMKRNLISVTGRPGALLNNTDIEPMEIQQPISYVAKNDEHALQLKDELADWLITDEPVELEFDDEPGRIYFAIVQNTLDDFEKIAIFRKGTIQFLCLDPFGYGTEKTATFPSDAVTLTTDGTAEADPIFELEVLEPVTFAMIQNQDDEYMMIGRPAPIESIVKEEYTSLIDDNMSTLVGWGDAPTVTDGYLRGEIESDGARFFPSSFGTAVAPLRWQGPGLVKSLPEEVQDFEMNVLVRNENIGWETGMIEAYLLDSQDRQIARIHLSDSWENTARLSGRVQLGHDEYRRFPYITGAPGKESDWNNFYGIMKLQRRGNRWWFYFARSTDGRRTQVSHKHYIPPVAGIFEEKVAKVQIVFRKWPNTSTTRMGVYGLKFWKINSMEEDEVPIIADTGDIITFDHKNDELLINGEDRKDLKDFGAEWFKLKKGGNQLIVQPSNSFETSVRYRDRYR